MMTYEETMAWGASQYADVLQALAAAGHRAEFTQTGGMCAALIIPLEAGYYVLITDEEDTLSWARTEHAGWWVGLYADPDVYEWADGPISDAHTSDSGVDSLTKLVDRVMEPSNWPPAARRPR